MKHHKHKVKAILGTASSGQYHKDKNNRWRDSRGRFVSRAIAEKR